MAEPKKPAKKAVAKPPAAKKPVQASGLRRCNVCGTETVEKLCPVDGSKMADMEKVTRG